jgi:flagellar protein FliO/FliZ
MSIFLRSLAAFLFILLTTIANAQEVNEENENARQATKTSIAEAVVVKEDPEVGKHVMANTDAGSMILSLLMVLALIFISALVLKRFNVTQQNTSQLKVVASVSLGVKERLIVAQVGEQQLVLGVTPQQITLIKSLEEPIVSSQPEETSVLPGNVLAFLQKKNFNNKNKS